jgi:hypothetical protein
VSLNGTGIGTFIDKNIGTNKTFSISGVSLNGSDASNYILTQPSVSANITAKGLTVTGITANNKIYDGTTTANLNTTGATLVGVVTGDSVSLNGTGAMGIFADANVGTGKMVTISGLTLTGSDAGNYTLPQPIVTANIVARSTSNSNVVQGPVAIYTPPAITPIPTTAPSSTPVLTPVPTPTPTPPPTPTPAPMPTPTPAPVLAPSLAQSSSEKPVQSLQPGVVAKILDSVNTSTTVGGRPVTDEVAQARMNVRKVTTVSSFFSGGTLPWYVTQSIDPRTLAGALVSGGAFLPSILGRVWRRRK